MSGVSSCGPVLLGFHWGFMGYFVYVGHRGGGKVCWGFHLGCNL